MIQDFIKAVRPCLTNSKACMNSCLIARAVPTTLHRDDEAFIDPTTEILSVSVGAKRPIQFVDNTESREESIILADCSAYVMSRKSQAFWRHGKPTQKSDSESQSLDSQVRYSFTFRHLAPHFRNSTVITALEIQTPKTLNLKKRGVNLDEASELKPAKYKIFLNLLVNSL